MAWEIEFYKEEDGTDFISEFLDSLTSAQAEKATRALERLEALGTELGFPDISNVRNSIYELRTQLGKTNIRFLYSRVGKSNFLVLLGIVKNSSKLKRKDIFEAESRLERWTRRDNGLNKGGKK